MKKKSPSKTINSAYNYLLNLDKKTLDHYYDSYGKSNDMKEAFKTGYNNTKLVIGSMSGVALGTTATDLMNRDLKTSNAVLAGIFAFIGAYAAQLLGVGLYSYLKTEADFRKNKKKFRDASEIVKMGNRVDDEIAEKVMYIDHENINDISFRR